MDITRPLPLLGGLSPADFMRRHWHKRPLLVRQALPGIAAPLPRGELFALAARDDVESRLVEQRDDVPLKILANFEPEYDWLLEPGDMLYLPPRWAHDGVAEGECMTCSVGFRAPSAQELAHDVLQRLLEGLDEPERDARYRDPAQAATAAPGRVPEALQGFAHDAVAALLADPRRLESALGEWLSEPKPAVWFEPGQALRAGSGAQLDRRT